ncbi:hypothetical protein WMY93_002520 [Mugilogobius chulae]|uniref:Uncharacterized protein n=1 Tax=Mugilogobius chulae TaxID=88201 RepID=A0AAW0Q4Z2_9GOBI
MDNLIHKLLKPNTKPRRRYFTGYVINGDLSGTCAVSGTCPGTCTRTVATRPSARALGRVVGLCLRKLNIHPYQNSGFNHWKMAYSLCRYRRVITVHQISPEEMHRIWNDMSSKKHLRC